MIAKASANADSLGIGSQDNTTTGGEPGRLAMCVHEHEADAKLARQHQETQMSIAARRVTGHKPRQERGSPMTRGQMREISERQNAMTRRWLQELRVL